MRKLQLEQTALLDKNLSGEAMSEALSNVVREKKGQSVRYLKYLFPNVKSMRNKREELEILV